MQRSAADRKNVSNKANLKKVLLNRTKSYQDASQHFSAAKDVIAFIGLIHLTADQNDVSLTGR